MSFKTDIEEGLRGRAYIPDWLWVWRLQCMALSNYYETGEERRIHRYGKNLRENVVDLDLDPTVTRRAGR
jgi:hypothetical protein